MLEPAFCIHFCLSNFDSSYTYESDMIGDAIFHIMNADGLKKLKTARLTADLEKILNLSIDLYIHYKKFDVKKLEPFLRWWISNCYGETMSKAKGKLKQEQKVYLLLCQTLF